MAALSSFSHQRVGSRSSILNTGGYGDVEQPSGSCNYRDLSFGTTAPVCGCQRFYLNSSHWQRQGQDAGLDAAWCFCGHHACFHDAFAKQRAEEQGLSAARISGVGVVDDAFGHVDNEYNEIQPLGSTPSKAPTGLGIQPGSRTETQSINTRVWQALNEFARNQEDGNVSITTSKLPSTAAPSVIDEPARSPNRMLQQRVQQHRSMRPPVHIPQPQLPRNPDDYSATEIATPSIAGTPDFRALASSSNQAGTSPGHLRPSRLEAGRPATEIATETIETLPVPRNRDEAQHQVASGDEVSLRALQDIVRTQNQRLEVLESLSFSHVHLDDIVDKFELFDGRLLDLEHWRTEQENQQTSPEPNKATASSSKRRRLLPDEEASFASDGSFDSNAAAHAETAVLATLAANAETHPRIDRLESRVADLENAAPPSFARPWHVQVVLLPWGRDLRGIWFSAVDATQHSLRSTTQASEEWTTALEKPKLAFKGASSTAWTTESIEAWAKEAQEWLSPKACGPRGTVFQRLASRGLVKDITLTASDARHVLNALDAAFENSPTTNEVDSGLAGQYQGLTERFIPVRKVRKDSRLRFMSPAEMVTSASWTAQFLDSSVFMKVGDIKRLYVTTHEAYTQPSEGGWTWSAIQDLLMQKPTTSIDEACWAYNPTLDQAAVSNHASFASHLSQSQSSQHSPLDDLNAAGSAPAPISPRSSAAPFPRQRTVSFPSSMSPNNDVLKADVPKRRVASFEPVTTVPIEAYTSGHIAGPSAAKRRRISISPEAEAERRGVNFTPRWSREPPSPFTSEAPLEARSQGTAGGRRRGGTPFAYATPHSNSNFAARFDFVMGDGDTEANTEVLADNSDRGEDEWEGVDDGTNIDAHESDADSLGEDDEGPGDEDELDDGI